MFTIEDVRKKADELHARRSQELKDLDVDRVDGVDRPATGLNFILMKSEARSPVSPEDVARLKRMARDEAFGGKRKATSKVSFADVMIPDAARTYPVESQEVRTGPRVADEGEDALGRPYDDGAYAALGGLNAAQPDVSPIPVAGTGASFGTGPGDPFSGDTRNIDYEQENFGRDQGGRVGRPPMKDGSGYVSEDATYVLPGGMRLLSPQASGIATPLDFRAPRPAQVVKRAPGLFRSVVLGPMAGPSRTSTYFDAPRVEKTAKELGDGLFSSAVYDA